jgi:hypothetical protein
MLSAYRSLIEKELLKLRYDGPSGRAFQYGYISGVIAAYEHSGAIDWDVYKRLQAMKNNAFEHALADEFQPGAAQIKPL